MSIVGYIMAQAMDKVGKDGAVTIEDGKTLETQVAFLEGMQFDKGYLSPYFINHRDRMSVELENAYILIHEKKISTIKPLIPLLEGIAKEGKPLVIIAEDVESEALAALVVNTLRGVLQVAAVKAPGFGDRRKAILEDIGILTGAQVLSDDLGLDLAKIEMSQLGQARKIVIDKDTTTLIQGAGQEKDIQGRIAQIKMEIDKTTSDYDREKLQERLAKLTGGVARITVGAATETEMKEKKARIDDALHACRAASEEGILPGGGVAMLRALPALDRLTPVEDEAIGIDIVRRAVQAPLRQIVDNAGMEGAIVLNRILAHPENNFGYDALRKEYGDMVRFGIIVPTKVERVALQNGASVASLLLATDALICEIPDKRKKGHAMPDDDE